MKYYKSFLMSIIGLAWLTSCTNQEVVYPDFDYQTVYFASQYPARTVELGEELFVDNTNDNLHKILINATLGGTRDNKKDVIIDFTVDTTLCRSVYYTSGVTSGTKVIPMPSNYYTLASNKITIKKGSIVGGVEVQLTEAFFADPKSLTNTYVIPLLMNNVAGADSILRGNASVQNPNRNLSANWVVLPKDYVLYTVKYINPWQANYLRRGVDQITKTSDGSVTSSVRHKQYVENDDVVATTTTALKTIKVPLSIKNSSGTSVPFNVILTFTEDGTCVASSGSTDYDITGNGKFVSNGEKKSLGGSDRSALYLDYTVNFKTQGLVYATKDTFVVRDRGVKPEYLTVTKK